MSDKYILTRLIIIKRRFEYFLALSGYFLTALFILGGIIGSPGTIGLFHDWPIGPFPEMVNRLANDGFYIWDSQLGNKVYPTDWIFLAILFPFSFLGGEVISKALLLFIMTLSGFSAFCLGKQLKLSSSSCFIVGILYVISPVIFTRVVAGYIYYLLAYALSPLILSFFLRGTEEYDKRYAYFAISGLLLSFAVAQIQFLPLLFLVLLVFSLVNFKNIKNSIRGMIIIFTIAFLVNLFPIVLSQVVLYGVPGSTFSANQLLSYDEVISSANILDTFRLLGYDIHPYSYSNLGNSGIIPSWIFYLNFIFPVIGFSALIFRSNGYTLSFGIIALIGLFFLKGPNPPFAGIFTSLFLYGFYIFREIWHLAFLYGLSLTFLAAFVFEKIKFFSISKIFRVIMPLFLVSVIIVSNGYPLLIGNFGGFLQTYQYPREYQDMYNQVSKDSKHNVLILPFNSPMKYDGLKLEGIDPIVRYSPNHIFPTWPHPIYPTSGVSTWLLSVMQENKTSNFGKLLTGFGIEHIILRKDFVSNFPNYVDLGIDPRFREKWYKSLEPFLDAQKDLVVISNTTNLKIYENANNAKKIFVPQSFAGGLSDFNELLLISNSTSLSDLAVFPSMSENESLIFIDNAAEREQDLIDTDFIEAGRYADSYDANQGWTDNINWFGYDYVLSSRIPRGAFTTAGNSTISIELPPKYENKPIEIWAKALVWNRGGKVEININGDNSVYSLYSTNQSLRSFRIFEGIYESPYSLTIKNINGENYVEGVNIRNESIVSGDKKTNENKRFVTGIEDEQNNNLIANPGFVFLDNQSGLISQGLPSFWNDTKGNCVSTFKCTANFATGWGDNTSLQISTNISETWSEIHSKGIDVNPNEQYDVVTHMKLNEFATQSHIALEAFNETSGEWYQFEQCP
jgi:hypothetical protein